MNDRSLQIVPATLLFLMASLCSSGVLAQSSMQLQFVGAPGAITCTNNQLNVAPGLSVGWNLTASTQVQTTVTANGIVVKQNVKPLPSATGTSTLDGITTFATTVQQPYTLIYALTPLVGGAPTSAVSFDCANGTGSNFKLWNAAPFTTTSFQASLENPQVASAESGIGLISGWACGAQSVQVSFDGTAKISIPYGAPRLDTASICGTQTNSGFGLLFNYNTLGAGIHTVTLFVNGSTMIGSVPIFVTTPSGEFLSGAQAIVNVGNFPVTGKAIALSWQQATQNFTIATTVRTPVSVAGNYQGAFVGTATGCGSATTVNMTNVLFAFTQAGDGVTMVTTMPGATPSSCTFTGNFQYNVGGAQHSVPSGNYTCNNGTTGTWLSKSMVFTGNGFAADLEPTTGTCSSVLNAAGALTN